MLTQAQLHKLSDTLISTNDSLDEGLLRCGLESVSRKEEDAIQDALREAMGIQACIGCGAWVYELDADFFCEECAG